jgi:hypothetical protein
MNLKTIIFLTSVSLFVSGKSLYCQKLTIETILDTNIIALGDQTGLHYKIDRRNDVRLMLPHFSDTLTSGVEIIGNPVIDSTKVNDDLWQISITLKITSFDTGIYYLPAQPIVLNSNHFSDTLFSRAAYLMVKGVAIDTTYTVRDIKEPARVPVSLSEVLLYTIPVLVLIASIFLGLNYFRKRKSKQPLFKPLRPEEPAYITALRELDKIKALKLWQQKQVKDYYTRITHVVRWYIEKRFSILALELTTEEILEHIRKERIDNINYSNLESLLNLADLVKFAKEEPDPEANIIHLDNAYDFIKQSRENKQENDTEASN